MLKLKSNGLEEQTVKVIGYYLNHLAASVDMGEPENVKAFIANKNVDIRFKGNLVKAYNYYALVNSIVWERPRYKWEQNKPKIPCEATLDKIIARAFEFLSGFLGFRAVARLDSSFSITSKATPIASDFSAALVLNSSTITVPFKKGVQRGG